MITTHKIHIVKEGDKYVGRVVSPVGYSKPVAEGKTFDECISNYYKSCELTQKIYE